MKAVGLNPRFVGQVFRLPSHPLQDAKLSLNPRFVGQVFRRRRLLVLKRISGLNPRFVGQVFRHVSALRGRGSAS